LYTILAFDIEQKVVAISVALKHAGKIKIWTLGDEESSEAEMIQRFFDGVERYQPTLVTWNGSGFDLPVLHYRALLHIIIILDVFIGDI